MLSVDDMVKMTDEEVTRDGLVACSLTEPSQLFLHGFGDEFPDTVVCPYCGKTLEGRFGTDGVFSVSCDCEDYAAEADIRARYSEATRIATEEMAELAKKAKESALSIVKLNKDRYLEAKEVALAAELSKIAAFRERGTN